MNERLRDFLRDLRENWDDHYWWARHQALYAIMIGIAAGVVSLLFAWLETRVKIAAARSAGE
jgi:hypothetical protein